MIIEIIKAKLYSIGKKRMKHYTDELMIALIIGIAQKQYQD